MLNSLVLLADHVRMALEYDCRHIFKAGGGFLDDEHVAGIISPAFEVVRCGEILQICYYVFFMTGFTRNRGDFLEIGKYGF